MSDLKICECCGHPLPTLEVQLELTRAQRAIFAALQRAGQAGATIEQLIDRIYGDNPNGPPLTAANAIQVQRHKMQTRLLDFGLTIVTAKGRGSVWRLEAVSRTERSTKRETANAQA